MNSSSSSSAKRNREKKIEAVLARRGHKRKYHDNVFGMHDVELIGGFESHLWTLIAEYAVPEAILPLGTILVYYGPYCSTERYKHFEPYAGVTVYPIREFVKVVKVYRDAIVKQRLLLHPLKAERGHFTFSDETHSVIP
jgi:hypothetical protein